MISHQQIDNAIKCLEYHHFRGTTQTACCCTLQNGYSVVGVSPQLPQEIFDIKVSQEMARQDAEEKVGALLAFVELEIKGEMAAH